MSSSKPENLSFFKEAQVSVHLSFLFGSHTFTNGEFICIRGIGEKGTGQEGKFREEYFFEPAACAFDHRKAIIDHCKRWSQNNVACFVIPAILREARATAENVKAFTSLVIDLDNGDTDEKYRHLTQSFGEPGMAVASGGTTETGHAKLHVWYALSEDCQDIERAIRVRGEMARLSSGDMMFGVGVESNPFGRAHQPIRLAGTVHSKDANPKACNIISVSESKAPLEFFFTQAQATAPLYTSLDTPKTTLVKELDLFTTDTSNYASSEELVPFLQKQIHEGGGIENRWSVFNQVAGTNLHSARLGHITLSEARDHTYGWMQQRMVPPWPDHEFDHQWSSLVNKDLHQNGPISPPVKEEPLLVQKPGGNGIFDWAASRWIVDPKPSHTYLVEGLIIKGEPHSFVAEGGSGKTFLAADLALKVAAFGHINRDFDWCGQRVIGGGAVVLILCEDSKIEMHRRLMEIDTNNIIPMLDDRLIVLPMPALGGAFPVAAHDKRTGELKASQKWDSLLSELQRIPNLAMVVIDTFASISNGDENSASAVQETLNTASLVCARTGASLVITHHIRKQGDEPIRNSKDMLNQVRGSTAFTSFFRVNIGMWHSNDYQRRMKAMGLAPRPDMIYRFAVLKCNINGLLRGERTLLRNDFGLLEDATERDLFSVVNIGERLAWLVFAVKEASLSMHPYTIGGKNASNGLYKRRTELPTALREIGSGEFQMLIDGALQRELLVVCAVAGSKSKTYLDVPDGPLATDEIGAQIQSGAYKCGTVWNEYMFDRESGSIIVKTTQGAWEEAFSRRGASTSEEDLADSHSQILVAPADPGEKPKDYHVTPVTWDRTKVARMADGPRATREDDSLERKPF